MDRINVMVDDTARSAAAFLARELGGVSVSAAIRFALFHTAKRKGWKPERVVEYRRTEQRHADEQGGEG